MSIDVGNLPFAASQEDVSSVCAEYGTVKRVQLLTDREIGRMRGFGFVEMETEAEEMTAIESLSGSVWMRRKLKVNEAKPRLSEVGLVVVGEKATRTSFKTTEPKRD